MIKQNNLIDFLIIVPPAGITNTIYPPYGALYIAASLRAKGHTPAILNVDTDRISNDEIVDRIKLLGPAYIGFSGIVAPSYNYIKSLSLLLKRIFREKKQILGGGLASAVEPVFKNTAIDIIVQSEGDITIVDLISCLKNCGNLAQVNGIYYRNDATPAYIYTGKRSLILNLDTLPYPAFDLLDMDKYIPDGVEFIKRFIPVIKDKKITDPKRRRAMMTIPTSRGCFGECSFCFRAYRGIRLHSIKYVFDFIEYCIKKFNVGFFSFGDECFSSNKARNWEFINEYKRRRLDFIFRILGMRVDTVDHDILKAYKDIGCWMIEYGFESGSQKMLNVINKWVTVELNRQVAIWTQAAGIYTSPTLVLGMPGETESTIRESIDFVNSLNFGYKQYQWSYALPIPNSPLYEFARLSKIITDEDAYLTSLDGKVAGAGVFHVNLTDEPDEIVAGWEKKIKNEIDSYYFRRVYKVWFIIFIMKKFKQMLLLLRKDGISFLLESVAKKIALLFFASLRPKAAAQSMASFRKSENINIEQLFSGLDNSTVNRDMSLKIINRKLYGIKE